ncbi:MAG: ribosomal protection-like ABC-F family protein [Christensenellales bacterium]
MAQILVNGLTFAYEGSYDNIFENVSFSIDTDWKLGFTGRNGRGKTTFLNLLMQKYAYEGSITRSVAFDYFPFEVQDVQQQTLSVMRRVCPGCEEWVLLRELFKLEVEEDVLYRPFSTLSHGERTKVLLAALFSKEGHFLLIDEPTNHLDIKGRELVGRYLNSKKGFILVSHDRAFLDLCVDHILSINRADIEVRKGNFSSWYFNKQQQDARELSENERLKKEIGRLNTACRRTAGWSNETERSKFGEKVPDRGFIGHKSAKMMKRAKSLKNRRQSAVADKEKLLKNIERQDDLKIQPLAYHTDCLVTLKDVRIRYGAHTVCEGVSLSVCRGERIVISGKNGSGKSSLLKLIAGEDISYSGSLHKGSNLIVSYVAQGTAALSGGLQDYARHQGIDESLFMTILRKFDLPRVQFEKNLEDFSAGQKKKVLIARSLCERAHLYIWDEPLNYIDVFSRMQIEKLLMQSGAAMVLVEHDRAFIDQIATRVVLLG